MGEDNKPKLWNVGANYAADFALTRDTDDGVELLAIRRRTGEWAIPGGFVEPDQGEDSKGAAFRELFEECGVALGPSIKPYMLFRGKVDDPRNTSERWIETTLIHAHLDKEFGARLEPQAGSDAREAAWMLLTDEFQAGLYADHPRLVSYVRTRLDRLRQIAAEGVVEYDPIADAEKTMHQEVWAAVVKEQIDGFVLALPTDEKQTFDQWLGQFGRFMSW